MIFFMTRCLPFCHKKAMKENYDYDAHQPDGPKNLTFSNANQNNISQNVCTEACQVLKGEQCQSWLEPRCGCFHTPTGPHHGSFGSKPRPPPWRSLRPAGVRWFGFTQAQKVNTRVFIGLVRNKQGRCEMRRKDRAPLNEYTVHTLSPVRREISQPRC